MRKLTVFTIAILMSGIFTLQAADKNIAVRTKLASELLKAMKVGKMLNQTFDTMKQMQGSMIKKMVVNAKDQKMAISHQQRIMDLMKNELSWEKLRPEFEKLYAESYSAEELEGLIKFYKSPLGEKLTSKQPEMQKKAMAMVQKMMTHILPKIQALTKKMQQEIIASKAANKTMQ